MLRNPIIIAAPPRSGTTMVAGLLKLHGAWVGRARVTNHPGSNSLIATENQDIKKLMKTLARTYKYNNWSEELPEITPEDAKVLGTWLREAIEKIVPHGEPWLVKTAWTLIFYDIWKEAFPGAKWVIVSRHIKNIVQSVKRHPKMALHKRKDVKKYIKALHKKQDQVWEEVTIKRAHYVYADALSSGHMGTAGSLLTFCGITFNPEITRYFIKPEMFHRNTKRQADIPFPIEGGRRYKWLKQMIIKRGYRSGAELGCARGKTTKYLLNRLPELKLICVDLWDKAPQGNGGTQYKEWNFEAIYSSFTKSVASQNGRVRILRGLSWEAASLVDDESLDFVFIDADHEYESVKKDIIAWTPKLKPGGTLCGHDTHFSGVQQAIQELIPNHNLVGVDHLWECKKEDVLLNE